MANIQKQTYLDLIISNPFSDDCFAAKSITLEFLYSFDDSSISIFKLKECLCQDNFVASLKFNGFLGVLLAVEEYNYFYPTTIIHEFLVVVIEYIINKIDDYMLDNYVKCMKKFLQFISENINHELLYLYLDAGERFIYSSAITDNKLQEVFRYYCNILVDICKTLKIRNPYLLKYKLSIYISGYKIKIQQMEQKKKKEEKDILLQIYGILKSFYSNTVLIVSDSENIPIRIKSMVKKYCDYDVEISDSNGNELLEEISGNEKIIVTIGDGKNVYEMVYLIGKIEEKMGKDHLLVYVKDSFEEGNRNFFQELKSRYADKNSFEDKLKKFLKAN